MSTQTPFRAQQEAARTLRLPNQNVGVITHFEGGGFGGKTRNQQVVEAARLARLTGKPVQVKGGKIFDENFDTYDLPRFTWLPEIETVLVDNPTLSPQGCGEPAITPTGAVIANAVYDAIGVRLYELPMTPVRIQKAIK